MIRVPPVGRGRRDLILRRRPRRITQRQGFCVDTRQIPTLLLEPGNASNGDGDLPLITGEGGGDPNRDSGESCA